ncbi:MAG: gliding motility-associated C-terminal domain-containing protein, partial [Phaeodactylibacter sp.]|nr:gliding motility-associated C-terminal domain-containing protein [Phaeodactylibacter sp.]
ERGRTYCYRILARFARETTLEPPQYYNVVESLPSMEVCMQLSRDVPLMTNVDVDVTSPTNGQIKVRWTKPNPEDLDTLVNPGPYTYEVLRATGIQGTGLTPIGVSFTSPTFWQANDTSFTDNSGLNTLDNAYTYQIAFYTGPQNERLGNSNYASSPFLGIASTDETNNLSWDYDVPWENFEHRIFRLNGNSEWVQIGTSTEPFYSDQGLVNGREYCYYVETIGDYNVDGIDGPLYNRSQESCGTPLDTIPPCPPALSVKNLCSDEAFSCIESDLINDLDWINPMNLCPETDDVVSYNIYYAPFENSEFELLESIDLSTDTVYQHRPDIGIAGCYAVTAVDTFFNESAFSNIVCVDNCPVYELPNAFTPNGDNQNDLFIPYPYCFIEEVEFQVINRWGEVVFETNNPDLNWDGRNSRGQDLPQGVYYYTCKVFERRVTGIVPSPELLKGYIELVRDMR